MRTPSRFVFPSFLLSLFSNVSSASVTAISFSFYCATTLWWTVKPIQLLLTKDRKKKWNVVVTHTNGRDSLGFVLCVAGLLLLLTLDLPTLPGFFQYTELYCCFTLRATQLNICNGIKRFFLSRNAVLVQYSYPKFLSVSLVVDDWSAEHKNHSLLATNCNLFLLCYVLFVGGIVHCLFGGGNVFATFFYFAIL